MRDQSIATRSSLLSQKNLQGVNARQTATFQSPHKEIHLIYSWKDAAMNNVTHIDAAYLTTFGITERGCVVGIRASLPGSESRQSIARAKLFPTVSIQLLHTIICVVTTASCCCCMLFWLLASNWVDQAGNYTFIKDSTWTFKGWGSCN